jgi:hypothetical protein
MTLKSVLYHQEIDSALKMVISPWGGVYRDDLCKASGIRKEIVCAWLKSHGFVKISGHMSTYWQNAEYPSKESVPV